jgi:hypothetical protein
VNDREIAAEINHLVEAEHELERKHVGVGLDEAETAQLRSVEVQLDQCWDLLRQRRARRSAGQDPEAASSRKPGVVEGYLQ